MSIRTYLIIGFFVGLIVFLINQFFGEDIVRWLLEQQVQAAVRNQRVIELVIYDPLIFMFDSRPAGAIAAAVLWPLVFVWLLLLLIALVVVPGLDVVRDIEEVTQLLNL